MGRRPVLMLLLAALAMPAQGALSQGVDGRPREPFGFDFKPDAVWRVRARRVRLARARALALGDFRSLNSALAFRAPVALRAQAAPSPTAVSGVLKVPYFLVSFRNTDPTALLPVAAYDTALTFATAPPGRPYTVRTYYEEMSNGLLSLQGQVLARVALDSNDTWYEGNCNALCSSGASPGRMAQLMREAILGVDSTVNFGLFDNDGPDGIPNSDDDDGEVDIAGFIQPELGGECVAKAPSSANNIWSHRYYYSAWTGQPYTTNDPRTGGGPIRIDNYTIQSGVGGSDACTGAQIMGIGTIAHEMGHGLGLDDLYDTNPDDGDDSEGVGHWGLMGSGGFATPLSPASMEAFSRAELGWIAVRALTLPGSYQLGPTAVGDTAFLIRPTVANLRGEYFLLENRQAALSDTALIRSKGPGLLIWHVDSTKYAQSFFLNEVNSGPIHAVWLRQADGLNHLRSSTPDVRNRGDAGDPFPGTTNNTVFGAATNPSSNLNTGLPSGIQIDSIRQVTPGGAVAFHLLAGSEVRASDTAAVVRVNGVAYSVFRRLVTSGAETLLVDIDSVQTTGGGVTRFEFRGWSDSGARSHTVIVTPANPLSLVAQLAVFHRVTVSKSGNGTITISPSLGAGGSAMLPATDTLRVTASPSPQNIFVAWDGDTTSLDPSLALLVRRPLTLTASFTPLLLDSVVAQLLRGSGLTDAQQSLMDLQANNNGVFDLGDFVAWLDRSGTTVSAQVMARVLGRLRR
ncbi:MAG: M6 family metalloprotease domain-containing protein [Gemmatimonadales bacterium]|nr:M6 family metalloprotease domain-containing protein [Gemmatimonadales bacterium]